MNETVNLRFVHESAAMINDLCWRNNLDHHEQVLEAIAYFKDHDYLFDNLTIITNEEEPMDQLTDQEKVLNAVVQRYYAVQKQQWSKKQRTWLILKE